MIRQIFPISPTHPEDALTVLLESFWTFVLPELPLCQSGLFPWKISCGSPQEKAATRGSRYPAY